MRIFSFSLLFVLLCCCTNNNNLPKDLIDFAPPNTEVILRSNNLEALKSAFDNNALFKYVSKSSSLTKLKTIDLLNHSGETLICLSKSENDSLQYTFITHFTQKLFKTDSLKNYIEEALKYKSHKVTKSTLENDVFFSTLIDSVFILSSSKKIIDNSFKNTNQSSKLKNLYTVIDKNEDFSLLLKTPTNFLPTFSKKESLNTSNLTDFISLDISISQDDVFFNGITKSKDSSQKLLDVFKNTIAQENQIQEVVPGNSDGFLSFTFEDFSVFKENLKPFQDNDSLSIKNSDLFNYIQEVGLIYEEHKRAVVLNSFDIIASQDALISEKNIISNYRDIDILEFSQDSIFSNTFSPFISVSKTSKYCLLDHFFVFSSSIELLQNIIANYQNKTTLNNKTHYKFLKNKLSNESSLLFVNSSKTIKEILDNNKNISDYNLYVSQFVYDSDFSHLHGGVIKGKEIQKQHTISESFSLNLQADLINNPQFVTNHNTKQKEIVVQDIENNLYLISNNGKVLWKKQLNGPILGDIEQIDMYKNRKLQLAFVTPNKLYVIDRKGRDVLPFPLKFNDEITQPLAVFDYERKKNYRLLVTQGKNVIMYNARGKLVKGFKFKYAKEEIITKPKHFRIKTKDYLVFKTKNKLHILNRVGRTRIKPKTKVLYSKEPVFVYQNKFTTTTEAGKFISIDTNGNSAEIDLGLSKTHHLETTSKTRVTLNGNELGIKSRVVELDYGNYTRPKIFYINDKIYISITDLQSKKVSVYDSQAKMIENFPIYGSSKIDLANIDRDKNLEFIVKGENNSIILYQIN